MTSEWNYSTINDVCVLVTDGSHSSPKSVHDGEYMVSVKDFTDYGFDFSSCRMISHDDYEVLKRNGCVSQIDDILIEYSARDCAARPLKLSIHSGGIEHACRRR